jgi:hypothetical protein
MAELQVRLVEVVLVGVAVMDPFEEVVEAVFQTRAVEICLAKGMGI